MTKVLPKESSTRQHVERAEQVLTKHFFGMDGKQQSAHGLIRANLLTAFKLGFDVGGFDELNGTEDEEARENAMVTSVRERLDQRNDPVIVVAGRYHVPKLVRDLREQVHVISLATVDHGLEQASEPQTFQRHVQLLRDDTIRPYRSCVSLKEGAFTNFLDLADKVGVPMTR